MEEYKDLENYHNMIEIWKIIFRQPGNLRFWKITFVAHHGGGNYSRSHQYIKSHTQII